jgi:tetratricopeptide (TPR) repeat protein
MRTESILRVLTAIKEYWFLITLAVSAALSVTYMLVYQVSPWDKQRAIKRQKDRTRLHNLVGHTLLEGGHYALAKKQFEQALDLANTDQTALNGRFLSELFLEMDSPNWDPAVGLAIQNHLTNSKMIERERRPHIVEFYLGKLHERIGQIDTAKAHYERALELKSDYSDALYTLGWFHYLTVVDLTKMENAFKRMTEIGPYDYRGFHGLGYALYMKAVRDSDPKNRSSSMLAAAEQAESAKNLGIERLNIVMDFGEVARSVNPDLSLFYHDWGARILDDPKASRAGDNPFDLGAALLLKEGQVRISGKNEKLAWIEFQLALDNLALHRMDPESHDQHEHDAHFQKALLLDPQKKIHPIYEDQLAILNLCLPGREG